MNTILGSHTPRHVAVAVVFSAASHRVLMITSRKHHLWILPKGGIEKGETSGQAAVREAWEEAGTPRSLPGPSDEHRLLTITLKPGPSQKRAAVWHVHVIEVAEDEVNGVTEWPECHERQREWVTPHECLGRIQRWYSDGTVSRDELEGDAMIEGEELDRLGMEGKKDKKGGAMELALRAFTRRWGWEKDTG
ncbi:MAG: hypothetical protein TREMPRED_005335 [Tremellales sp. Tagirdzhanova-0007]|nr:MAG: hypothetical protein TREMPRED_005335 [Tremellales sp. Tagirdzhanova-0007]